MTADQAWPQDGGIAYSTPGDSGRYPTIRSAIHGAKTAADAGDTATADVLRRAISRGWHLPPAVAA